MEPVAAELAATRGTPEGIARIKAAVEQMHRTIDDRPAFIRADVEFHVAIGAASGNVLFDRLSAICEPLLGASFALQGHARTRDMVASDTVPGHTAVYEAIAARDAAGARRAMEALLAGAVREVSAIPWDRLAGAATG